MATEAEAEYFDLDMVRCPECGGVITGVIDEAQAFPKHKSSLSPQGCPYPSSGSLVAAEHFRRRRTP